MRLLSGVFWLGQSLVGHSHNFCAIFTPAHLVGRTNYSSKGLCLVDVSAPEVLPGYRRCPVQALYPPLLEVLARVTLTDTWEFPLLKIYCSSQDAPRFQLSLPVLSPSILPIPVPPPVPIPTLFSPLPLSTGSIQSNSPSQWDSCTTTTPLRPSCYLASLSLWVVAWFSFTLWLISTYKWIYTMYDKLIFKLDHGYDASLKYYLHMHTSDIHTKEVHTELSVLSCCFILKVCVSKTKATSFKHISNSKW